MIEINNIKKKFGDRTIIDGISGRFEDSNTSLIIGASGTGKSVLLKCIVGLIQPDEGDVLYDGRSFYRSSPKEVKAIRREMGMLFQGGALFDSLTVEENVRFPLDMMSPETSDSEKRDRVHYSLERVDLEQAAHKKPSELSGGMRKRVGIARAIVMNPKYLFCDEPNSGLDPMTSIKIDELISDITDEFKMTTLVVTHDMNSVMGIGEYILFLHQGRKEWEGDRESILHSDNAALREFVFASKIMESLL